MKTTLKIAVLCLILSLSLTLLFACDEKKETVPDGTSSASSEPEETSTEAEETSTEAEETSTEAEETSTEADETSTEAEESSTEPEETDPVVSSFDFSDGTITKYNGAGGDVVIPSEIDGAPVTAIAERAFLGCNSLTSITIPESVTSIGDFAFWACPLLGSITVAEGNPVYHSAGNCLIETAAKILVVGCSASVIPSDGSVTVIGAGSFAYCGSLASIAIPEGVTIIGTGAFTYCVSLTGVTIPASVTSIGDAVFTSCKVLITITVAKGNPVYHSTGNCLIETASKTLVAGCKESVIPSDGSVTSIGKDAFYGSGLTSITIPESVTSIGEKAFTACVLLTEITFDGTVAHWEAIVKGDSWYGTISVTVYFATDEDSVEYDGRTEHPVEVGHVHAFNRKVIDARYWVSAATHESPTLYHYSCACGEAGTDVFAYGLPIAHTFDQQVTTEGYLATSATHQAAATYYYSCECGEKGAETFTYGNPIAHIFDQQVTTDAYLATPATHKDAATYYYSCECGEKGSETFSYGEPVAHTFDKQVTTEDYLATSATHQAAATYYYSCECGEKGTETFSYGDPIAHTFDKQVTTEAYLAAPATHQAAATYYYSCECGKKGSETFTYGEPIAHTFDQQVTTEAYLATSATHQVAATYYYSCECGEKGEETFSYGEPIPFTVSFDSAGGTLVGDRKVNYGDTLGELPIPSKVGYTFEGWYYDGEQCFPTYIVAKDLTLQATWSPTAFSITYEGLFDGQNASENPATYTINDAVALAEPTRKGYTFAGWSDDGKINKGSAGDKTFTASWEVITYSITYNPNGGTLSSPNPETYTVEDEVVLSSEPTRDYYTFAGWSNGGKINRGSTGDKTFTASWTAIRYNITYVLNGGTNAQTNPRTYTVEDEITLIAPTRKGYAFKGWSNDGKIDKGSTDLKTFTAEWEIITYTITYIMKGGTNAPTNPSTYTVEDSIILAEPTGYPCFEGWSEGDRIPKGSIGNRTFTANWNFKVYEDFELCVENSVLTGSNKLDSTNIFSNMPPDNRVYAESINGASNRYLHIPYTGHCSVTSGGIAGVTLTGNAGEQCTIRKDTVSYESYDYAVIEADFRWECADTNASFYIGCRYADYHSNYSPSLFGDLVRVKMTNPPEGCIPHQWNTIKIVIDLRYGTFDFYVNNTLCDSKRDMIYRQIEYIQVGGFYVLLDKAIDTYSEDRNDADPDSVYIDIDNIKIYGM